MRRVDDLPKAAPAMWRALKRGYQAEPLLLLVAFGLSLLAAVPDALIDEISLIGPPARIRDRLQAWQEIAKNTWVGSLLLAGADSAAMRVIAEAVL